MEIKEFIQLIKRKKQTIISVVLVFLIFSVVFTVIQPFKYSTASKLMVVQNFKQGIDPYAAAKSNEYLSTILSKVITSGEFFDRVVNTENNNDKEGINEYAINENYFTDDPRKKMKKWQKMISARPLNDTGIIDIEVFHEDPDQAMNIAVAINLVLKTKHQAYHGAGDSVTIKIINRPITSKWPVKPNIALNIISGLILGFVVALTYVNVFPEDEYDVRLFPRRGSKKNEKKNNFDSVGDILNKKKNQNQELNINSGIHIAEK